MNQPPKSKELIASLIEAQQRRIGMADVTATANLIDALFKANGVDYAIIGGYAVQKYGYVRFTHDLDMVVRDRDRVRELMIASGDFKAVPGSQRTVIDRATGVQVDLLPANRVDSPGGEPYPEPADSSSLGIKFVTLPQLIALKLSTNRSKDIADVVELIKANELGEDFTADLPSRLSGKYLSTWAQAANEADSPQPD